MHASPLDAFAHPVLLADIGGTNARFAVVETPGAPFRDLGRTPTADHPDPMAAIERFVLPKLATPPRSAILAVAAAIEGDAIPFTNSPWVLRPDDLRRGHGLEAVVVVNDFEAQALALPHLGADDLVPIGGGTPRPDATMAVVGPGTGLGVGLLVRARGAWIPVPGEGGHVEFAPGNAREAELAAAIAETEGRVSAETMLAGPGIARLHAAILKVDGKAPRGLDPAGVTAAAAKGEPEALEALGIFATALGRFCGDVALMSLPHGGLFLAGGIPPRVLPLLADGRFRAAFEAKPPYRSLMAGLSTRVVVHPLPAFVGLAAFARDPAGHAVALDGRLWR